MFPENVFQFLSSDQSYNFFWKFMAAYISMGIIRLPSVRNHFEKNHYYVNKVTQHFISRNLFENVLQKMTDNLKSLCNTFQKNVQMIYSPTVKCSIDETILSSSGKSEWKVYIVGKPHPNGMKLFTLVDKFGILCSFIIYKKQKINIYTIFNGLLSPFKNQEIKIYADRWFGSQSAMDYCLENNIKFLLTIPKNRPTD